MEKEKFIKNNAEQAVASWVNYLNQVRVNDFINSLNQQHSNFSEAIESIDLSFAQIKDEIISKNRGGDKGMHGFIAEIAEKGIGNARERVQGNADIYTWINDNGPTDLIRNGVQIQQKFVNAGGHLSLEAINQHLEKYPNYLANGGKYQIPKDHYDAIMQLLKTPKDIADKASTRDGFSLKQWKEVHDFFAKENIRIEDLEPSLNEYKQVQKNAIADTLKNEKQNLKQANDNTINTAYIKSKASVNEGAKASMVAATIEGGTTFIIEISKRIKKGKHIGDFTSDDWIEIGQRTGVSFGKGSIRGATIYTLTNFTATPAAVANSIVTASFGVADLVYKFNSHAISEVELYENAQILCLEATISALSSFIGQVVIPIPVIGAVIGNTLGTLMHQVVKNNFDARTEKLLIEYADSLKVLDEDLDREYRNLILKLNEDFEVFIKLIEKSFSPNIYLAFEHSAQLASYLGVPQSEILDNKEKLFDYFLE